MPIKLNCHKCHKELFRKPSHANRVRNSFCSKNCLKGSQGWHHTQEWKKQQSIRNKGESNPNFGNHKLAGKSNPNFGKHWMAGKGNPRFGVKITEEMKETLRQKAIGYKHTPEAKLKMSQFQKGRKHTREHHRKVCMAKKDTSIELKLQNFLKENNIPFETHYPILGQPDIFIKPNIAIFADGCYWHGCKNCGKENKLANERDALVTKGLQKQGYTVIRLWEHNINKNLEESLKNFNLNYNA